MGDDYDFWGSIGIDESTLSDSPSASFDDMNQWYTNTGEWDTSNYTGQEIANTAQPGQEGYGWRYFTDGTSISPDGKYYTAGSTSPIYDPSNASGFWGGVNKVLGAGATNALKSKVMNADGSINPAAIGTALMAIKSMTGGNQTQTGGYQGKIPSLQAIRQQVQYNDENRRPGEAGRQYFTDVQYVGKGDQAAIDAAKTAAGEQASGLMAAYQPKQSAPNKYAGSFAMPWQKSAVAAPAQSTPASGVAEAMPVGTADEKTGALKMAKGGIADLPRYLRGKTDGMADKIDTTIDDKEPAKLSHGEFVIPADVVSHLGNGNSDAGADKLYQMMARIRKARTGNPEQGKQINPDKFMPGGAVKGYAGITDGSLVSAGTTGTGTGTSTANPMGATTSSTLSPWAGDYVTDMLGKGQAMSNQPYQAYTGPLTAGASDLQQQQFAGLSDLAKTGLTPTQYTGGVFNTEAAQQYMNPYLKAALDPQLQEMQRRSDIARLADAGRLTKAGAYGGSRQAIMESEGRRNLLQEQNKTIGQGYATAYDKAMGQFNEDARRRLQTEQAQQAANEASANFGLKTLNELGQAGAAERGITAEGIAADKAQFEEARDYPYKMVQYQKDLLTGLPITTQATTPNTTQIGQINQQLSGILGLYQTLAKLLPQSTTQG